MGIITWVHASNYSKIRMSLYIREIPFFISQHFWFLISGTTFCNTSFEAKFISSIRTVPIFNGFDEISFSETKQHTINPSPS